MECPIFLLRSRTGPQRQLRPPLITYNSELNPRRRTRFPLKLFITMVISGSQDVVPFPPDANISFTCKLLILEPPSYFLASLLQADTSTARQGVAVSISGRRRPSKSTMLIWRYVMMQNLEIFKCGGRSSLTRGERSILQIK